MSDDDLANIRQKKLRELQKKFSARENKPESISAEGALKKIFKDRAWEVFNCATEQFPDAMSKIKIILVKLASEGRLKEVTGEDLYVFLRNLGLTVKLNTKINYSSHGQMKSLEQRMKEELQKPQRETFQD
jgi:DNA-binding TFAR19-related protein (PDSD5 family)